MDVIIWEDNDGWWRSRWWIESLAIASRRPVSFFSDDDVVLDSVAARLFLVYERRCHAIPVFASSPASFAAAFEGCATCEVIQS